MEKRVQEGDRAGKDGEGEEGRRGEARGVRRDYLFTRYLSVEVENSSGHVVKRKKIGVSCQGRG